MCSVKKRTHPAWNYTLTAFWILSAFLLFYLLRSPSLATNSVRRALDICAAGLIPSLFPFIVLVTVFNSSGLSDSVSYITGRPLGWLFGIEQCASSAILLGTLGGFPIGAMCARELYDAGTLAKSDTERLITFTNNASPAFCIGVVGISLFNDAAFGLRLYMCQIGAAMLIGIIQRKKTIRHVAKKHISVQASVSDSVTSAVSSAMYAMLKICAFAVFFAVVGDALCLVLSYYFGEISAALGAALCELTLAARSCAELNSAAARPLCALAVGWSGISVHMQVASILSGSGISMRRYFICKLLQGMITGVFISLLYCFCP